jgi:pyruvate/oxaloacetate carboxyltransferase
MTTEQAMRVLPIIKNAGYNMFELWGGATLDSAIRFTKDDPWERLERFGDEMGGGDKIQSLSAAKTYLRIVLIRMIY